MSIWQKTDPRLKEINPEMYARYVEYDRAINTSVIAVALSLISLVLSVIGFLMVQA